MEENKLNNLLSQEIDRQGAQEESKVVEGMKSLSKERFMQMLEGACDSVDREIADNIHSDGEEEDEKVVSSMKEMSYDKFASLLKNTAKKEAETTNATALRSKRWSTLIHRLSIAASLVICAAFAGAVIYKQMTPKDDTVIVAENKTTHTTKVITIYKEAEKEVSNDAELDNLYAEYNGKIEGLLSGASDNDQYREELRRVQQIDADTTDIAEVEYLEARIKDGSGATYSEDARLRLALKYIKRHDMKHAIQELDSCRRMGGIDADLAQELYDKLLKIKS